MRISLILCILLSSYIYTTTGFGQTNDEKAVGYLDNKLKLMFNVLNDKPQTISTTCMDSLKKLHNFKNDLSKKNNQQDIDQDVNIAILRSLYSNSVQFCDTDTQYICNHRTLSATRENCKRLYPDN